MNVGQKVIHVGRIHHHLVSLEDVILHEINLPKRKLKSFMDSYRFLVVYL